MRILFVLENYLPHIGGVEVVFSNLCEGLAKKGHDVIILTRKIPGTRKDETINGVKVHRISCANSRYLFTFWAIPSAIRLAKWADVIHTTTFNAAPPAWLAAKVHHKKIVLTVHETWLGRWHEYSDFPRWKAWMHELLERAVFLPKYDTYACVSNATATRLREVKPKIQDRVIAIHNGFDATIWKRPRRKEAARLRITLKLQGKYVIFGYGRPGTSKGFSYLLASYPLIAKRINNAVLVLMLSRDKQYAHVVAEMKKNAPQGVVFIDPQPYDELANYTHMADCIVIPSITEGFGYTTVESCASRTPIVASDTTSIPEVIWGKYILVKPKSPPAIADGVHRAYKKQYTTSKERRFPWSDTVKRYESTYKKLCDDEKKKR